MKKLLILICALTISILSNAQENKQAQTEKVNRIIFLNPAFESEMPISSKTAFSTALGIGYGGGYPDLTAGGGGFIYVIAPFSDNQFKWFYNLNKRLSKGKIIEKNSGNFISLRLTVRGHSIAENVRRTSDFDFAFGPTWGFQRSFGNFHLLFDIGPQYYFDTKGNGNIFPIVPQINLGYNLIKK